MKYQDYKNLFPALDMETYTAYKSDNTTDAGRVDWYSLYLDLENKYNC